MNNMKYESEFGVIYYHDMPWNINVLGGKSLEIDSIKPNSSKVDNLISAFCKKKSKESYVLVCARYNASQINLKKLYLLNGFVTVEHTLDVYTCSLDLKKVEYICNRFPVYVEDYTNNDTKEIEDIAMEEFKFGRLFEDPFIDPLKAKKRSRFWIRDIINEKATIKVIKKKNIVLGFMYYKIEDNCIDLVLGGMKDKHRHLAYGFWANILMSLKDYDEIHTMISSSNIDILNLYSYFGFKFKNAQFGVHKHL